MKIFNFLKKKKIEKITIEKPLYDNDYEGSYEQYIDIMRSNAIALELENQRNEKMRLEYRAIARRANVARASI